jgi:hypothetical protein
MTPPPQKNPNDLFIITEEELRDIELRMGAYYAVAAIKARSLSEHDTAIRTATLDVIIEFTKGNSETIEADDGTLEDAVFLGELLAKIESLRGGSND